MDAKLEKDFNDILGSLCSTEARLLADYKIYRGELAELTQERRRLFRHEANRLIPDLEPETLQKLENHFPEFFTPDTYLLLAKAEIMKLPFFYRLYTKRGKRAYVQKQQRRVREKIQMGMALLLHDLAVIPDWVLPAVVEMNESNRNRQIEVKSQINALESALQYTTLELTEIRALYDKCVAGTMESVETFKQEIADRAEFARAKHRPTREPVVRQLQSRVENRSGQTMH